MRLHQQIRRLAALMRWGAGLVVLLLCLGGVLEGAGLLLLIPLLGAIGLDIQQGAVRPLANALTRTFNAAGLIPTLPVVLSVFVAVNAELALLRRAQTMVLARLEQDVVRQTTEGLYRALLNMNWLSFSRLRASDVTVALTSESERVGLVASQLLSLAASLVVTMVYLGLALRLSVPVTVGVFACGLVLVLLLKRRTARATTLGAAFSSAVRTFHGGLSDDLAGMKTIRSFGAEARSISRFEELSDQISSARIQSACNYANATFWLEAGSAAVLSLLVLVAVAALHYSPAELLLLLFLFGRVVPRLASLQQNVQFYAHIVPSWVRVIDLEAHCLAAAEAPAVEPVRALTLDRRLRLDSVSLDYDPETSPVLRDFTLTIDAGTTVALVGASGAGKTTAADLMMGLLAPQRGRMLVDDHVLTPADLASWRRTVAYVPQDTFLFNGTIRANLRWAVPAATDTDLDDALLTASADFVFALPHGIDTEVGDRGVRLSGGERQRVALARALLRRPSLLILDEATNAVDAENERRILDAINRLHGSTTILLITHRLSAVTNADVIHVLDDGHLVESGSWEVLAARNGRFRTLWEAQNA